MSQFTFHDTSQQQVSKAFGRMCAVIISSLEDKVSFEKDPFKSWTRISDFVVALKNKKYKNPINNILENCDCKIVCQVKLNLK